MGVAHLARKFSLDYFERITQKIDEIRRAKGKKSRIEMKVENERVLS